MFKKLSKTILTMALTVAMISSSLITAQAASISVDVEDLFDAEYYTEQNPDVKAAFGNDYDALLNHYLTHGMKEGRAFSVAFDIQKYKKLYPDLVAAFGDDWSLYVTHYLKFGINEKRDGGGEFDIVTYMENNPDLVAAFGLDFSAYKNHYITCGKAEGRVAMSPSVQASKIVTKTVASTSNSSTKTSSTSKPTEAVNPIEILHSEGAYYNITAFEKDYDAWLDKEPELYNYLNEVAYNEAMDTWKANEPSKDDYIFAYENEDVANAAFESAYETWLDCAPAREDFINEEAYEVALEEYCEEYPEPVVEDYPYFADGYNNEEAARLAYEAAFATHVANTPTVSDFVNEEEFATAMSTYEANEPKESDFRYYENTYESAEAAAQAFANAKTAWETAKAEALNGLTPDTDEYNTALETFLETNTEPTEAEYTYHENEYESAEAAGVAFTEAYNTWSASAPSSNDYIDVDAFNEAVAQHNENTPTEDVFKAKINQYESQNAATEVFETAHTEWENNAPKAEEFIDTEWYELEVELYEASEPKAEDFVTVDDMGEGFENTYASQEEADTAYITDHNAWESEIPNMVDYADGYEEDLEAWEDEIPVIEDYEVEEENIPENAVIVDALG